MGDTLEPPRLQDQAKERRAEESVSTPTVTEKKIFWTQGQYKEKQETKDKVLSLGETVEYILSLKGSN